MSAWIMHVKMSAKKYGISYSEAMKDPRTKASYKTMLNRAASRKQIPISNKHVPKITKKDEVVTERAYIVCLCIAGVCLLGCLFCFLIILGGGEDDNSSLGMTSILLFGAAILFVSVPLVFQEDAPTSSNAPRIDPKTITAVAAVYTAYQVRKIREELRDTSDSGGGDSGGGDS